MGRAHYQDGELVPYKPGAGIDPKPAAANDGTIINVCPPSLSLDPLCLHASEAVLQLEADDQAEDLFYNMPLRKRAFKSPSDEYNRVLDVITKYAIHNPHSAWSCKKVPSPHSGSLRGGLMNRQEQQCPTSPLPSLPARKQILLYSTDRHLPMI
jgi:hypothetical protein